MILNYSMRLFNNVQGRIYIYGTLETLVHYTTPFNKTNGVNVLCKIVLRPHHDLALMEDQILFIFCL